MTRKFGIIALAVLLCSTIVGGTFGRGALRSALSAAAPAKASDAAIENIASDYESALQLVTANYAGEINHEKASQAAIQSMLWTLDPHSTFFPPDEFRKLREDQESRFYGIGVSIRRYRNGVYVAAVIDDAPAERKGLRYGDLILEVNGQSATEWSSDRVSKEVRGQRGEPVTLKIQRAGAPAPLYFTVVRDAVPLPSIRTSFMVRPGVGYVGLTGGFQHTTDDELRAAIGELRSQGMRQLVLDLRDNPGGLLDQAINVSSEFLPRGQAIVSVRARDQEQPIVYKSSGTDPEDFPLVVLINRNSASASEIVSGAIQDHGRGLVVGQTSFGKGLVQRVFLLPLGNGLTLTTAKYYTPYGRLIQRNYAGGALYDYYVRHDASSDLNQPGAQQKPAVTQPGQPAQQPPIPAPPLRTGPPVRTAGGRVFYGGGGITPDIEVKPFDYFSTPERIRIVEAAFLFTRELISGQVPGLESYRVEARQPDATPRATDFPINEKVLEAFRDFVKRNPEIKLSAPQLDADAEIIRLRLREEVITAAYGGEPAIRNLLESDPQLQRAIEVLPDAKRLAEQVKMGVALG